MNTHKPIAPFTSKEPKFLDIKFNQDQGCFAIGHEYGFHVYNTDPIDSRVQRNFYRVPTQSQTSGSHSQGPSNQPPSSSNSTGSGIGHITMLHRTNYLALVGGGKHPRFSNNKVIIWDDLKRKTSLTLEFLSPVLQVLLSRIRIIVVLRNQVLVYGFSSPPKKFATYETIDNEFGLADLSVNSTTFSDSAGSNDITQKGSTLLSSGTPTGTSIASPIIPVHGSSSSISSLTSSSSSSIRSKTILAFPARSLGQIQLVDVSPTGQEKNLVSIIKAHKSHIRCLTLNRLGTLIASASETGTIIRVHSTHNTALLYEFRRGLDRAIITSMKFSHNDSKLAVLSDKNTLHVFNIEQEDHSQQKQQGQHSQQQLHNSHQHHQPVNRQHLFRKLPIPIPNYFNSTWSFCSVNINKYHVDFVTDNTLAHNGNPSGSGSTDSNTADIGVLAWSGNDSVIIVWKEKRIWERYVIIEKVKPTISVGSTGSSGSENNTDNVQWEIVRDSWKSLEVD
ncbi:SVP1-like protein 2 [[Candida] railenensis]|uniref:SVP1-like protein 2 n=1 Tax=[Candida] railenensis TaxID=45579 RepID=A0A9P0VZ98_9ASCO|nr:SVP1-like protein 2 [[Candida] railenensis]